MFIVINVPAHVGVYMSCASSLLCSCKDKKGLGEDVVVDHWSSLMFPGLSKSKSYLGSEGGENTNYVFMTKIIKSYLKS